MAKQIPRGGLRSLNYSDGVGKLRYLVCLREPHDHDPRCPIARALAALYAGTDHLLDLIPAAGSQKRRAQLVAAARGVDQALDQLDPQRECRPTNTGGKGDATNP